MALLCFSALTSFAFVGWVHTTGSPWGWKGLLAGSCAALAVVVSALIWWRPSRANVILGIVVMLGSLARVGGPHAWTWVSFALIAVTFLLLMPLVHAAIVLRND